MTASVFANDAADRTAVYIALARMAGSYSVLTRKPADFYSLVGGCCEDSAAA